MSERFTDGYETARQIKANTHLIAALRDDALRDVYQNPYCTIDHDDFPGRDLPSVTITLNPLAGAATIDITSHQLEMENHA